MRIYLNIAIGLLVFVSICSGYSGQAYNTISVEIAGNRSLGTKRLDRYYEIEPGGSLKISTPFYIGSLQANLSMNNNSRTRRSSSGYSSITATLEWLFPVKILQGVVFQPGIGAGNYLMHFYIREGDNQRESEICLCGLAGVDVQLSENIFLSAAWYGRQISTFHKIYLSELNIGLTYQFQTPQIMKDILR